MTLEEFFRTLSDMELVALIQDARAIDDKESLNLALIELGNREKNTNVLAENLGKLMIKRIKE